MFLLACPGLAFWLMDFKPVMQNGFLDPYIYTAYINNFVDLFERYGATYYGVRFGMILPAQLMTALFGPIGGYFAFRYVLALIAGVPFYVLIRQRYGRPVAIASLALLMTSPFLARTMLWDYPDASGVPFVLAAICLFSIEHKRRWLLDACAGVCAGMAIHSNVFALLPLSMYLGTYAVLWLVWRRGVGTIVRRLLVLAASVLVVTACGAAFYWWKVGHADIFSITLSTVLWLTGGGMASWRVAGFAWVMRFWWVLAPVFLAILAPIAWTRPRVAFHEAVFWTSAVGILLFYYVYQFALNGTFLQLFYYFSYTLPFVFLLLTLVIAGMWGRVEAGARWIHVVLLLATAIGPWVLFSFERPYFQLARFDQYLAVVGVAAVLLVLSTRVTFGRPVSSLLASAALGLMFACSFAAPGGASSVYGNAVNSRLRPVHLEMDIYRVALQFMEAVPTWSQRPGRIRFWYSNRPLSNPMQSIQSTYLWGYSKVQGEGEGDGLPAISASDLMIFNDPDVKWLGLLAERPEQLAVGRTALLEHGVAHTVVDSRALTAGAYTLHFELLDLQRDR